MSRFAAETTKLLTNQSDLSSLDVTSGLIIYSPVSAVSICLIGQVNIHPHPRLIELGTQIYVSLICILFFLFAFLDDLFSN